MEVVSGREPSLDQLRRLYRFMSTRRFVASRDELITEGFSLSRIRNWIRGGRLIKVFRAVYCFGRDLETPEAIRRAALLAAGSGSALIGRSACESWGIVRTRPGLPRVIEVGMNSGRARTLPGLSPALRRTCVKIFRRNLEPGDLREKDGLALARAALALIDFAANATVRDVRFAFLEACRLQLFTELDLKYCYTRAFGRRGVRKLKPYLDLWVPELLLIRSVLEGWFLLEWVDRKLPMPKVNEKIFGREVDMYWARYGVVLELDGDAFHSDPAQKKLDLEKQRYLESRGLIVLRITFKEFEANPSAAIARVLAELGLA